MVKEREPVLTPADIERLKRQVNPATGKKYTQSDIAEMYGVTRQHVSWVKRTKSMSFSQTPREKAMENYPWTVPREFHQSAPDKRLRDHLEYMATGGKGMSTNKLERLRWFYSKLYNEDLVVEYHPDIPSSDQVKAGGYAYRQRKPEDGDLIIRLNEVTTLTSEGEKLWRFPPRWPDPNGVGSE